MITHVIVLKFRDTAEAGKVKGMLEQLPAKIPEIRHLEAGINVVPSGRAYDLCLYSRFDSLEDLRAYQQHPDHVEVARYIGSVSESVVAVDYET